MIGPAKKVLLSLMVVGSLTFFTLTNTFAILSSQESNKGGSIASGTLTLGNQVGAGTVCFSYGSAGSTNSNPGCDALFSNATLMYPGQTATADVTITDSGSIKANTLSVYMPSCTMVTSPSAPSPGGANPCTTNGLMMYIAETNSSFSLTGSTCVFPVQSSSPCTLLANTLNFMATTKYDATHVQALGPSGAQGVAAGASRYFVIAMGLPATAANTLQGEEALFKLTWLLTQ